MGGELGVWGIDIGHCALKALRCVYDAGSRKPLITSFDTIEHAKILSQPDANPDELIRQSLTQFLARNPVGGHRVAVSVPGQNGLARFFQLSSAEKKKIPERVRFEARQQIPFPLDDVVWDYQVMDGANEVDGFLHDAEVGLFAMKRDQVSRVLEPFLSSDVEVHHLQLAPLCVYNFLAHHLLAEVFAKAIFDADDPPESYVVLNVGTDTTDLLITNGFRIWQRSIPLGGNHFTRQLTKELKLTFAKAEHLKRHVQEAADAKSVLQAMRPVFNDFLTEVQRSIGYFQHVDRRAKIAGIIPLGNAMKLLGLQQYLSKNLGYQPVDVKEEAWDSQMAVGQVWTAPQFKENLLSFAVCYGLCLQGLDGAKLKTNLLPKEISRRQRRKQLIRSSSPWAIVTVAVLLLALVASFFFGTNRSDKSDLMADSEHEQTTVQADVEPVVEPAVYQVQVSPQAALLTAVGKRFSIHEQAGQQTVTVESPDGETPLTLVVVLDGYESQRLEFKPTPGESRSVSVFLEQDVERAEQTVATKSQRIPGETMAEPWGVTFFQQREPATSMAIAPRKPWIALASEQGDIALVDLVALDVIREWRAHDSRMTAVAFDPSGQYLITGAADRRIVRWRVEDGALHSEERVPLSTGSIRALGFSSDARRVAFVGTEGLVISGNNRPVFGTTGGITLDPRNGVLAWGTNDRHVAWSELPQRFAPPGAPPISLWNGSLSTVLVHKTSRPGLPPEFLVLVAGDGQVLSPAMGPPGMGGPGMGPPGMGGPGMYATDTGGASPSGRSEGPRTVRMFRIQQMTPPVPRPVGSHDAPVTALALSTDARLVASGSIDGMVRVWQLGNQSPLLSLDVGRRPVEIALIADEHIVVLTDNGSIRAWELNLGKSR
jgi:type IV pilus assembly protein PilM